MSGQTPSVVLLSRSSRRAELDRSLSQLDAVNQQYIVNWNTDSCITGPCSLSSTKRYRLRVFVGALQLGFADVQVFASTQEAKNATTGESISLVNGRTLPSSSASNKVRLQCCPRTTGGARHWWHRRVNRNRQWCSGARRTNWRTRHHDADQHRTGRRVNASLRLARVAGECIRVWPRRDGIRHARHAHPLRRFTRLPTGVSHKMLRLHTLENGAWVQIPEARSIPPAKTVFGTVSHFSW